LDGGRDRAGLEEAAEARHDAESHMKQLLHFTAERCNRRAPARELLPMCAGEQGTSWTGGTRNASETAGSPSPSWRRWRPASWRRRRGPTNRAGRRPTPTTVSGSEPLATTPPPATAA